MKKERCDDNRGCRTTKKLQKKKGVQQHDTLIKTNIAYENGWFEDYFPFAKAVFQGLC